MKNKIIKHHSDSNWIKSFSRYTLMSHIIDSDSWSEMEDELKKHDSKNYQKNLLRLFNEFKFYNIILNVEYYITDFLNDFLIKKEKIKNWDKIEDRFLEKIGRNLKIKNIEEAKKILKDKTNGKKERMLTPAVMFDFAGFGFGELINYINEFTISFIEKKKLINKLTEFNESRKVLVHKLVSSRENAEMEIENGILKGKEITDLIDKIVNQ